MTPERSGGQTQADHLNGLPETRSVFGVPENFRYEGTSIGLTRRLLRPSALPEL